MNKSYIDITIDQVDQAIINCISAAEESAAKSSSIILNQLFNTFVYKPNDNVGYPIARQINTDTGISLSTLDYLYYNSPFKIKGSDAFYNFRDLILTRIDYLVESGAIYAETFGNHKCYFTKKCVRDSIKPLLKAALEEHILDLKDDISEAEIDIKTITECKSSLNTTKNSELDYELSSKLKLITNDLNIAKFAVQNAYITLDNLK